MLQNYIRKKIRDFISQDPKSLSLHPVSYRYSQNTSGLLYKKEGRPSGQSEFCFLILSLFHLSNTLSRSFWMAGMKQNLRHYTWEASDKSRTPRLCLSKMVNTSKCTFL